MSTKWRTGAAVHVELKGGGAAPGFIRYAGLTSFGRGFWSAHFRALPSPAAALPWSEHHPFCRAGTVWSCGSPWVRTAAA